MGLQQQCFSSGWWMAPRMAGGEPQLNHFWSNRGPWEEGASIGHPQYTERGAVGWELVFGRGKRTELLVFKMSPKLFCLGFPCRFCRVTWKQKQNLLRERPGLASLECQGKHYETSCPRRTFEISMVVMWASCAVLLPSKEVKGMYIKVV